MIALKCHVSLAAAIAISLTTTAIADVKLMTTGFDDTNSFPDEGFLRIKASGVGPQTVNLSVIAANPIPPEGNPTITLLSGHSDVTDEFNLNDGKFTAAPTIPKRLFGTRVTLTAVATYQTLGGPAGAQTVIAQRTVKSAAIVILVDNKAPVVTTRVERFPGGGGFVHLQLEDTDVDEDTITAAGVFNVAHNPAAGNSTAVRPNGPVRYDEKTQVISLAFANLNPGNHTLTIKGLKDGFQNEMMNATVDGENVFITPFSVPGGRLQGPHVEFPRFLRPNGDSSGFNPADRVDTRVVDLYYFRDARRVAQVINRNVRDLDQVGFDAAQQFAKLARDDSRAQIDERQRLENLAVQDAQQTRKMERDLATKQRELQAALRQQEQIIIRQKQVNGVLDAMGLDGARDADELDTRIRALTTKINTAQTRYSKLTNAGFLRTFPTDGTTGSDDTKASPAMLAAARAVRAAEEADEKADKSDLDVRRKNSALNLLNSVEEKIEVKSDDVDAASDAVKALADDDDTKDMAQQKLEELKRELAELETKRDIYETRLKTAEDTSEESKRSADEARGDADALAARAAIRVSAERAQLDDQIRGYRTERSALQTVKAQFDISAKEVTRNDELVETLKGEVAGLPDKIADQQKVEIKSQNKVTGAERLELRLEQERFRREVAAGLSDRDTYVAGKWNSQDPVTQVSITVLGPARLQLRGPIQGINKIRRMIHQIDTPVGQVKVGIHTVQINGEHGDRMDKVYENINKEISHSRFLVNTSNRLFQKAVVRVATAVGNAVDNGHVPPRFPSDLGNTLRHGTDEESHRWRYIYTFFGGDFINELRRMNSELLQHDNKLLSLHSMDSLSFAGALYVTSLARGDVREMILRCFQDMLQNELPDSEYKYLRNLNQVHLKFGKLYRPSQHTQAKMDAKLCQEVHARACRLYTFPNTINFFSNQFNGDDTLNPAQQSTIRLAQVLKAQLVAEREYKNIVLERSLLETVRGETERALKQKLRTAESAENAARNQLATAASEVLKPLNDLDRILALKQDDSVATDEQRAYMRVLVRNLRKKHSDTEIARYMMESVVNNQDQLAGASFSRALTKTIFTLLSESQPPGIRIPQFYEETISLLLDVVLPKAERFDPIDVQGLTDQEAAREEKRIKEKFESVQNYYAQQPKVWKGLLAESEIRAKLVEEAKSQYEEQRKLVLSKRLLEQFMDETEEKSVELLEALRSHASNVDNYLKRLAIAVEDDVNAQFYEPAFQRVRHASRSWDVNLGQVETTTILTNNRTMAKVSPSATMEFDLPKRDILLTEAFKGSKALATEYGNLMQDGTFLAGSAMLAGTPAGGIAGGVSPVQAIPGVRPGQRQEFGSALEKLIPDPSVYKFETGTGFEIRPVIQPDGHSIVYTFDYTYTTNVREPLRADEKHLGRVKRHFIHTDVQTSSYELREISRYMVSLKASRTARGVPLMEDIPFLGAAFRPLPSDESSLQQNVILASSVIYPTMFDLMGLRWSQYADDVSSDRLVEEKQEQLSRQHELRRHLLQTTRKKVNEAIGIENGFRAIELQIPPGPISPSK